MYEILGMQPRDGVLPFSEVGDLMHPDDGSFFEFARQIASGTHTSFERSFRMRHVNGQYLWLRARAEIVRSPGNEIHMVGVAVDVSENQILAQMTDEANARLQSAIENISETFVLWDAEHRLVLCNSKYQQVFGLTDADVAPGTPLQVVKAKARRPIEERKVTSPSFVLGERATETRLADGRWFQVSERELPDGSHVSIGTDVTQSKVHQERLSDSERRLMATINDLTAARRDAEHRIALLRQPPAKAADPLDGYGREEATRTRQLEQSLRAIDRVTGTASAVADPSVEDLDRLHRDDAIERRLAALKQGRPS